MSKFKVGEKVSWQGADAPGLKKGDIGEVFSNGDNNVVTVRQYDGQLFSCIDRWLAPVGPTLHPSELAPQSPPLPPPPYVARGLNAYLPLDPDAPTHCSICGRLPATCDGHSNAEVTSHLVSARRANKILRDRVDGLDSDIDRLRKELEATRAAMKTNIETLTAHPPDFAKLKAFSEDQARQIQKLEVALSARGNKLAEGDLSIGRLTRELERATRGTR